MPCRIAYGTGLGVYLTTDALLNANRETVYTRLGAGPVTKRYYAAGQQLATRVGDELYYTLPDPTGTSLTLANADGTRVDYVLYDGYGGVLTSTLPATLTAQGVITDPDTGLVYLGEGRWYDPALGRPLQPNPAGGPPTVPQALNRYAATEWGPPGVAEGTASLPALGYALSIAKNAASGALGYAVAEALGPSSYEITAFSQIGKLYLTANNKLLRNAGVFDLFKYVEQGGRGKSSEYVSNALVKKTGAGFFQVTEGEQVGRTIDVADLQKLGTKRWPVSNVRFELTELKSYATARIALSTFWRDFGWNAGIAIAIETPFFVGNVLNDPYLTPQQKGLQAGITLFGIGGTVYATTAVGQALGNVPGAVAGFVVGLGYEYFLVPIIIRPAIYQFTGVDPYDRTRRLAPLHSQ